jgi:tRNA G26 N,N-dimethylase Trm1
MLTLSVLKNYLQKKRIVRLHVLAKELRKDTALLTLMLTQLKSKGYVKKLTQAPQGQCKTDCGNCVPESDEVYVYARARRKN